MGIATNTTAALMKIGMRNCISYLSASENVETICWWHNKHNPQPRLGMMKSANMFDEIRSYSRSHMQVEFAKMLGLVVNR